MNAVTTEYRLAESGTLHRAFRSEGILFTAEGCNLDSTKDKPVGAREPLADNVRRCQRCFPYAEVSNITGKGNVIVTNELEGNIIVNTGEPAITERVDSEPQSS